MEDQKTTFFDKGAETALKQDELGAYCLDYAVYALESAAGIREEELCEEDKAIEDAAEKYMEKIWDGETNFDVDQDMLNDITLIMEDRMIFFPDFKDINYSGQLYCIAFLNREK